MKPVWFAQRQVGGLQRLGPGHHSGLVVIGFAVHLQGSQTRLAPHSFTFLASRSADQQK